MAASEIPTIKLELTPEFRKSVNEGNIYANDAFCFSACSEIKNGKSEQLFGLHSCRETYISTLIAHFKNDSICENLTARKTTLMIWSRPGPEDSGAPGGSKDGSFSKWFEDSVRAGVNLVNHFERECKWIKSKMYRTEFKQNDGSIIYVIEGSRWWMTSPHTISLFMLLLRLGKQPGIKKIKANSSVNEIVDIIKNIRTGSDRANTGNAWKWPILLKNRKAIFKGRKAFADNFKEALTGGDGIKKLGEGVVGDKTTLNRFNEFCKEVGKG